MYYNVYIKSRGDGEWGGMPGGEGGGKGFVPSASRRK